MHHNTLFPFSQTKNRVCFSSSESLMPASKCRSSKHFNASVLFSPNSDTNLGIIDKNSTNCNAKKSLLLPFTSNADIINNTNTTTTCHENANECHHQHHNHHQQQQYEHHGQHRSLTEINGSGSCTSNNNSPNLRNSVSPNTSLMDETVTGEKVFTPAAPQMPAAKCNKISPTPSRAGTVATPLSLQSQSDSLSSATTVSTATTIIPKEVGEMARRSSDSDLSVTPKGRFEILYTNVVIYFFQVFIVAQIS